MIFCGTVGKSVTVEGSASMLGRGSDLFCMVEVSSGDTTSAPLLEGDDDADGDSDDDAADDRTEVVGEVEDLIGASAEGVEGYSRWRKSDQDCCCC